MLNFGNVRTPCAGSQCAGYIQYMKTYLYHIEDPEHPGNTEFGYIGVSTNPQKRFKDHLKSQYLVGQKLRRLNVTYENNVRILLEANINLCYEEEHRLRPDAYMGWNLTSGGGGPPEFEEHTKERRSVIQKERMANTILKSIQGETFRNNYFANNELIELRRRRAREHMADPEKKAACLGAMHKKKKCPHCDYESNAGNVAQHIRKKHDNTR